MSDLAKASTGQPPPRFLPLLLSPAMRAWQPLDWTLTALLYLTSLGVYTATLAPTINSISFDSPELVTKAGLLEIAHPPGSPVYVALGHLFSYLPLGELAARVNWMSAVFGALTVALLYPLALRHLTGERVSALGGAAFFGLSLTFWSQAVIAELYTPSTAMLGFVVLALAEWSAARSRQWAVGSGQEQPPPGDNSYPLPTAHCLLPGRWWLVAAAGVFGLSLGIHLSHLLYLPSLGLFALLGLPVRRAASNRSQQTRSSPLWARFDVAGGALGLVVGLLAAAVPYIWVYFSLPHMPPGDFFPDAEPGWPLFYQSTFNAFEHFRFRYTLEELPDRIALFLHLLERNLGPVGLPLMIVGAWRLLFKRLRMFFLLLPIFASNGVFYVNYRVPDNDVFYIPAFWIASCLAAVGLEAVIAAVRALWPLRGRGPVEESEVQPPKSKEAVGYRLSASSPYIPSRITHHASRSVLAGVAASALVLVGAAWSLQANYEANDQSRNVTFRDFYASVFSMLPEGAQVYHRGASPGYDLLYYTRLCGVRPDLKVRAGATVGSDPETWPMGSVFSGITKHDCCLHPFIADDHGENHKWYDPVLTGMYNWNYGLQYGWLNLYEVRPANDVPMDWMVSIYSPESRPSKRVDHIYYSPVLVLVGIDAEAQARPGTPWRLVRYWHPQSQTTWMPPIVTILGDGLAFETHIPLFGQLEDYIHARQIEDQGLYVIRDEVNLVIPSNIPPGTYPVTIARAEPRLMSLLIDPAPRSELVSNEHVVTTVEIVADPNDPPVDPLTMATNKRCSR